MPASVLLVRHAPSVWNAEGRWQGQADPPLSPAGEAMAAAAAARVGKVDLVVTSGLERARRTAELLAPGVPAVVEPGLAEHDVGAWSGLTRDEIGRRWPGELADFDRGFLAGPPGGESRAGFDRRVAAAAGRAVELIDRHGAGRVLVVTHAGVIRALCRLGGVTERHVDHLCGWWARGQNSALVLVQPTCLCAPAHGPVGAGRPADL